MIGILECWECWNVGILGYWDTGMLRYWNAGMIVESINERINKSTICLF